MMAGYRIGFFNNNALWYGHRCLRFCLTEGLLLCLLVFGAGGRVQAQAFISEVQTYGVKEGLSHREIHYILRDRQGFMWIATLNGVNRFDGYHFQVWGKAEGLRTANYGNMFEDSDGCIWLSFAQTIDIITPERGGVFAFESTIDGGYPDRRIGTLLFKYGPPVISSPGKLLFNATDGVVEYSRQAGSQAVSMAGFPYSDPKARFQFHFISKDQTYWGILRTQQGSAVIEMDRDGKVLQRFDAGGDQISYAESGLRDNWTRQEYYFIDPALKKARRMVVLADRSVTVEDASQLLPFLRRNSISGIHFSLFGGRLISSNMQYVDVERGTAYGPLAAYAHFWNGNGAGQYVDENGTIWYGTAFGLVRLQWTESRFKRYLFNGNPDVKGYSCRGIAEMGQYLWVNTETGGFKIDKNTGQLQQVHLGGMAIDIDTLQQVLSAHDTYLNRVDSTAPFNSWRLISSVLMGWTIYKDKNKRILLGTHQGIRQYDIATQQESVFSQTNGFSELNEAAVISIKPDAQQQVWIAAATGFYRYDSDKGVTARYWPGGQQQFHLPVEPVYDFYQDAEGIYWLATNGDGLVRWNKQSGDIKKFNQKSGLPNNTLYAVYEDKHQHLWLASDYGIIQFDKQAETVRRVFLPEDGITHLEFNRISHFRGQDGALYFGGLNGVTAFHPDAFYAEFNGHTYPLAISKFQQFDGRENRPIDRTVSLITTNEIVWKPGDRYFDLEFALLSYSHPENILYYVKIEGVDADWVLQREQRLRINSLPYGTHRLKIRAKAASGLWAANELDIHVRVLRPFYLQAWFVLLCIALLAWAVRAFFIRRTRQLRKNQDILKQEVAAQTATIREQSEALRQLDVAKTRLYTNITHEFRTPLTVIKGLASELDGNEKPKQLIARNAGNLLTLVNQMLDLSKLEAGNMEVRMLQDDIVAYLRYLTESFFSLAKDKGISLVFESDTPQLVVDFDAEKIQYIVYNLLSNAIKFTPAGTGANIRFLLQQTDRNGKPAVCFKVRDQGIGIAPEKLPRVFDRFYQADDTHTRQGEGTGIGLTLVKELTLLMQGHIEVQSTPGQGTEFSVWLPITNQASLESSGRPADMSTAPEAQPEPVPGSETTDKPLLLLVEDNSDVAFYIQTILQQTYEVVHAVNGQQGLEEAFSRIPDIVISDVMMPEKDGYEVCEILKTDERTSHIPVILLTAKATDEDKITGLKTGADAYLLKPFHKEELFVRLDQLLRLRRTLQERYAGMLLRSAEKAPAKPPGLDEQFLEKLRQAVLDKIDDPDLDVPYLCRIALLSHVQVFRKLKALTGLSPSLFIRSIRLQKARELLQTTHLNISEIAYDVGFSDPNYFSRAFSETFGKPPSEFRK